MLISELTFPHLLAEQDAQLMRELEWRRVATERLEGERSGDSRGDRAPTPARSARRRWHVGSREARWDSTLHV